MKPTREGEHCFVEGRFVLATLESISLRGGLCDIGETDAEGLRRASRQ